jgi:methyl-accepting chemotaxis protein
MRIGSKLLSVCFILLAFMVAIGWGAAGSMKRINNYLHDIFTYRLPSIDFLIEADRDLQQLLVAERSLIFAQAKSDAYKKLMDEYQTNFRQSQERWNKFKALSTAAEDQRFIESHDKARSEWESSTQKVFAEIGKYPRCEAGNSGLLKLSYPEHLFRPRSLEVSIRSSVL